MKTILIAKAIQKGWITIRTPAYRGDPYQREYHRRLSAQNRARGLTATGRPRRNTPHPELSNLSRRQYLTALMRQRRQSQPE